MSRILVVDDNEPVRRGIQTLLGSRKDWFVCGEAADGLQAVKEAKSLRPDLIIMDVSMPNMNGLDAARIILSQRPRIAGSYHQPERSGNRTTASSRSPCSRVS